MATISPTLLASYPTFNRPSFGQAPNGVLYIADGITTPYRWNGKTAALQAAGISAPTDSFTVAASLTAGNPTGTYAAGYRYATDDEATVQYSALSAVRSVAITLDMVNWGTTTEVNPANAAVASGAGDLDASSHARFTAVTGAAAPGYVELFRSTAGQVTTLYMVTRAGATGIITSSATSGGSDTHVLTVPAGHHLVAGFKIAITGAGGAGAADLNSKTHMILSVTDTTITTNTKHNNDTSAGTWTFAGWDAAPGVTTGDTASDTKLNTNQAGVVTTTATSSTNVQITCETGHGLTVGDVITLTKHSVATYNNRPVLVRSVSTNDLVLDLKHDSVHAASTATWTLLNTPLPILDEFNEVYARKQVVPPDYKAVVVPFQDRMWYLVDVRYNQGTLTTDGDATIAGSSTVWTAQMVGRFLYINHASETRPYRIIAVTSATALVVDRAVLTSVAGLSYTIRPDPIVEDDVYYSMPDEFESVPLTNVVRVQKRNNDTDLWTGGLPYKDKLYLLKERSTYELGFIKQAKIDAGVFLDHSRGAANHECARMVEDQGYVLDEFGPWRLGAGGPDYFDDRIHNLWRDGTVDHATKQWWWVEADPNNGCVRFHVTTGSDTRPKTQFVYSYRTDTWWKETTDWENGGGCLLPMSGRTRRFVGAEDDIIYLMDQGYVDGTVGTGTALRGTVATVGTSTNLLLSATAATDCNGSVVAVVSGTGKRQLRRITAGQNTSTLTVSPAWTTTPAVGDRYQIGAIEWNLKLGSFEFVPGETEQDRELRLTYQPTDDDTAATWLDLRIYENHNTTASTMQQTATFGDFIYFTLASADVEVNMNDDRDSNAKNPGFARFPFPGHLLDRVEGVRFVTPEIRGYQGEEAVILYGLDIDGVMG